MLFVQGAALVTVVCCLCRVLYSSMVEGWSIAGPICTIVVTNVFLVTLQLLHNAWFCSILGMLARYLSHGYVR